MEVEVKIKATRDYDKLVINSPGQNLKGSNKLEAINAELWQTISSTDRKENEIKTKTT